MRATIGLALGLALAAPALSATPPWANPFNQKLMALSRAEQQGALRRAIVDSGETCGRLARSGYRGPYGNLGWWVAHCEPGGDYSVFTGPDGSVQVRACADMKGLKLPECGRI